MARFLVNCIGSGNPTPSAFEAAVAALFVSALDYQIQAVGLIMADSGASRRTFRIVVDCLDGGAVMSGQWQLKAFQGESEDDAISTLNAFIAANPTYFISPILYQYSDISAGQPMRTVLIVIYTTDLTNGAANWLVDGSSSAAPSGPAGGDLSGTYPNPTVKQSSIAFALTGVISPAALAGNTDNWAPVGIATASVIRVSATGAINLTGLTGGATGRLIELVNVGAFTITLQDQDAGSAAANQFLFPNGDMPLAQNASTFLQYDATSSRWRAVDSAAGGAPSGAAGGDLSGTYPNPIVGPTTTGKTNFDAMAVAANVIGSAAIATYADAEWEVVLMKANTYYSATVRANIGDGTNNATTGAQYALLDVVISPATGGTFDCPLTVDISGGLLRLLATPGTVGWSARVRQHLMALL